MANTDRFFQELDNIEPSPVDLSSYGNITRKREFLELGAVVALKDADYGDVTVIDRLSKYQGKLYDYTGEYVIDTGERHTVCFNEDQILAIKK